jgi:hypothetical protein
MGKEFLLSPDVSVPLCVWVWAVVFQSHANTALLPVYIISFK